MGVRVVTDSACDLPAQLTAVAGIAVVPLTIRFGDEELVDRRDLTPAQFWERASRSPVLPETAAPSPGAFEEAFRQAASGGAHQVLCINLSARLSATGQSAHAAAMALQGEVDVRVVDSCSVSLGQGLMVRWAAAQAAAGVGLDELEAGLADRARRTRVIGALDTLDALRKGGRIGGAQALLGSVLSIKPLIEVIDGKVEPGPKLRTRSRALGYLVDRVKAEKGIEELAVLHGAAPDVEDLVGRLADHFPRERIVIGDLGAVVGSHTGPRTIGVAYQATP
ncbi:MAG: DegV family protein [Acidimicrobiales bacterium]